MTITIFPKITFCRILVTANQARSQSILGLRTCNINFINKTICVREVLLPGIDLDWNKLSGNFIFINFIATSLAQESVYTRLNKIDVDARFNALGICIM